jgi:hypothetical protein
MFDNLACVDTYNNIVKLDTLVQSVRCFHTEHFQVKRQRVVIIRFVFSPVTLHRLFVINKF